MEWHVTADTTDWLQQSRAVRGDRKQRPETPLAASALSSVFNGNDLQGTKLKDRNSGSTCYQTRGFTVSLEIPVLPGGH